MRLKRIMTIILLGCIVLLGTCIIKFQKSFERMKDNCVPLEQNLVWISSEDEIWGSRVEEVSCNPGIYYEDVLLPYDKEHNRLYLPQNYMESEWYGNLTAKIGEGHYPIYILNDAMWQNKSAAIRESHDFIIFVQRDDDYYRFNLTITGMPMIAMTTERVEEAEEIPYEVDPDKKFFGSETRYYGQLLWIDSGTRSGQYQMIEAGVCYHYKGASTAGFEKKSYSFDLLDYRGEKADISLAGMRSDSSWKLNALNTDINRIREITASQIWESMDNATPELNEVGPNMEYVELVVDNEYKGLYCLVEPIDEKKAELDEKDILYKVIDWPITSAEDIQVSADNGWRIAYPLRIRYPKEIQDYQEVWYPMKNYLDMFFRDGNIQYEEAVGHIDIDNYCDKMIFDMVTSASDNSYKNTYYVADCGDGYENYQMKQIPWDLDYTFGNRYSYGADYSVFFDENPTQIYAENAILKLYTYFPEKIGTRLVERWNMYRDSILSTDAVINLLNDNMFYLAETGAVLREEARWPQAGVNLEIDYLIEFQKKRMDWLDGYFDSFQLSGQ